MRKQKWRNRTLERGVMIDKARGYVYVRFKNHGVARKQLIGRTTEADVIDKANFQAQQLRHQRRAPIPGFEARRAFLLSFYPNTMTNKNLFLSRLCAQV